MVYMRKDEKIKIIVEIVILLVLLGAFIFTLCKDKEHMRKDLGYWINMVDAKIVGNKFDNSELLEV